MLSKIQRSNETQRNSLLNEKKEIFVAIKETKSNNIGRKRKNDNSESRHSKYSMDNCISKLKRTTFNCVILTINKLLKVFSNDQIKQIDPSIMKDTTKVFNESLLTIKNYEIFLLKSTKKYPNNDENNRRIIEKFLSNQFLSNDLLKEIFNMTFEESIKRIFMMSSKEFKKKYSFTNKFLFENLKIDEKERMIIKNLIDSGIKLYFNKIKGRNTRSNKVNLEINNDTSNEQKITSWSLDHQQDEIVPDIIESPFSSFHNGNVRDESIFFHDNSINEIN